MKKAFLSLTTVIGLLLCNGAAAQDDKQKNKNKSSSEQQIVIIKKGDKDTKLTVETKDGEVFINGKPASEYKDSDVTISKGDDNSWHFNHGDHKFHLAPFRNLFDFDSSFGKKRGFLGIATAKEGNNVKVKSVTEGGAAEKAGLKEGDIITKIGDKVVNSPEELSTAVAAYKPDEEVAITFLRDGKTNQVKAKLGERSLFRSFSFDGPGAKGFRHMDKFKGFKGSDDFKGFDDLKIFDGPDENGLFRFDRTVPGRARLGIKIQDTEDNSGVKVIEVESGSAADKAGLKKDDVLLEIGGKKVTNTDEVRTELATHKDKSSYNVKVKRNGSEMSFDIKPVKKLKTTSI
jgi:serine protease Do